MPRKSKRLSSTVKSPQKLITEYLSPKRTSPLKKIYGYNPTTDCWHCITCGENLGSGNPRQLCGKYFCYYENMNE